MKPTELGGDIDVDDVAIVEDDLLGGMPWHTTSLRLVQTAAGKP